MQIIHTEQSPQYHVDNARAALLTHFFMVERDNAIRKLRYLEDELMASGAITKRTIPKRKK